MEVIILAGGYGKRLRHIINDRPKPMAEVQGRPFIEYTLDKLLENGVTKFVFAISYKREYIRKYFGERYKGREICYSIEYEPMGTGGAIKKALKKCSEKQVFIVNGDTFFCVDFWKMLQFHQKMKADICIAKKFMQNFDRYGTIKDIDGIIFGFEEKKYCDNGWINGGIYIINRNLLSNIRKEKFSFEDYILQNQLKRFKICAFESRGYFIDIGVPTDYYKAQIDFAETKHTQKENDEDMTSGKVAFLDRDGVINKKPDEGDYVKSWNEFSFKEGAIAGIKLLNQNGYKVIIITNQRGIAKGVMSDEDLEAIHKRMMSIIEKNHAKIDAIYHCPHEKGYCSCRKPDIGMFLNAEKDFCIDKKNSFIIGDSIADIEAGKAYEIQAYFLAENSTLEICVKSILKSINVNSSRSVVK